MGLFPVVAGSICVAMSNTDNAWAAVLFGAGLGAVTFGVSNHIMANRDDALSSSERSAIQAAGFIGGALSGGMFFVHALSNGATDRSIGGAGLASAAAIIALAAASEHAHRLKRWQATLGVSYAPFLFYLAAHNRPDFSRLFSARPAAPVASAGGVSVPTTRFGAAGGLEGPTL